MTRKTESLARETLRILKPFWWLVALSTLLGIVSGLSVTGLLATINNAMNMPGGPDTQTALLFAGLCVLTTGVLDPVQPVDQLRWPASRRQPAP